MTTEGENEILTPLVHLLRETGESLRFLLHYQKLGIWKILSKRPPPYYSIF